MHPERLITMLLLSLLTLLTACEINPTPPDRYALVYGVSDYSNGGIGSLNYTDDDAEDISLALSEKGYTVFLRLNNETEGSSYPYAENVAPATRAQFFADITSLSSELTSKDILIIYFSGHGGPWYTEGYSEDQFANIETEFIVFYPTSDDTNYLDDLVSDDEFHEELNGLCDSKKVVIIDACNSGGFIGQTSDFNAIPADFQFTEDKNENIFSSTLSAFFHPSDADITPDSAIVLSAAGEQETSSEPIVENDPYNIQNGFFTEGVLEAFQNGDYNKDGYIDTQEIYRYAEEFLVYLNTTSYYYKSLEYHPHISGGPVDFILFEAD